MIFIKKTYNPDAFHYLQVWLSDDPPTSLSQKWGMMKTKASAHDFVR